MDALNKEENHSIQHNFPVFSLRIAKILSKEGYSYAGRQTNLKNPKYYVYYYRDTEELRARVKELAANKSRKGEIKNGRKQRNTASENISNP